MTKEQREVLQEYLAADKTQQEAIKQAYIVALADIKQQTQALMNKVATSSVLYQLQYKKAMAEQIDGILTLLESTLVTDTTDYLAAVYDNGFYGSQYSMVAQGLPIAFGVDQKQVAAAINVKIDDYKFSDRIRDNVDNLKRVTKMEITRGIANGSTYAEIARNISQHTDENIRRASIITRTEAHRVQNTAREDAMQEAKKRGADVVKMWDSTLDGNTRRTHRKLDGQIRELDEPFEVDGHKAMRPGGFGRPEEDINCRCVVLERARWALNGKRSKLDNEHQFNPDGTLNYVSTDDKRYKEWKAELEKALASQEQKKKAHAPKYSRATLETSQFPDIFTKGAAKKRTQQFADYINAVEGADPDVIRLYANSVKLYDASVMHNSGVPFSVSYTEEGHAIERWSRISTGQTTKAVIKIPKLDGDNIAGQVQTTAHEMGHMLDMFAGDNGNGWVSNSTQALTTAAHPKTTVTVPQKMRTMCDEAAEAAKKVRDEEAKKWHDECARLRKNYSDHTITWAEYKKAYNAAEKAYGRNVDYRSRNIYNGLNNLEDIYDALTGGDARGSGAVRYGHGKKYYAQSGNRENEIWANYCALSVTRPDLVELLEEDQPELVKALRDIAADLNGRIVD